MILVLLVSGAYAADQKISCAKLTDDFCEALWSPKNKGNFVGSDFKVLKGDTGKSDLRIAERMNYQSYVDYASKFPEDFRRRFNPTAKAMKAHLAREVRSRAWLRKMYAFDDEIRIAIKETADERVFKNFPKLRFTSRDDLKQTEKEMLAVAFFNLKNDLLRIRFGTSEPWKRVERVFKEVRSDFLEFVGAFPRAVQERAKKKIESVTLSLPYPDPRGVDAAEECATDGTNAFYDPDMNTIVVCVGRFNVLQDDASFYVTLGHEFAHAVDPERLAKDSFLEARFAAGLEKLCPAKGPALTCDEWKQWKTELLQPKPLSIAPSPYDSLSSCLTDRRNLDKLNRESIQPVAARKSRQWISDFAEDNDFTLLAQPTIQKNGKTEPNEYFLRPDLARMEANQDVLFEGSCGLNVARQMFVQILACAGPKPGPKEFADSIEELRGIRRVILEKWYAKCGKECRELQDENLAADAGEAFADWVSYRMFAKRLAREKSLEMKRSWAARVEAGLCLKPGPFKEAPQFTEVEKEFSLEPHPDNRVRRLSVFQPDVAAQAQCVLTEDVTKGTSRCNF
jgi:hypothetical protein